MSTPSTSRLLGEFCSLLATTIAKAQQVTDADSAWDTPLASSQAGMELAAQEARRPEPLTGSWPWLLAPMIARWALQVAMEEAKGFSTVLRPHATSYAADVMCRGVLETSSLAWWLLDPGLDGQARLARSLLYRLNSADQTAKAITALQLDPTENRAEYGELRTDVKKDIADVGLTLSREKVDKREVMFCGGQRLPSYTERTASLVAKIWPQRKLPYAVLSAVAHGELLGLQRNLVAEPSRTSRLRVAPHPDTTVVWFWQDAYLVIGALIFTSERAAAFLGLHDQLNAVKAWIAEAYTQLSALRPNGT
jgi:hypothetical protein